MKQSPTEPPKKKLKQARLPFQILSPGAVKNPLKTPTQERKRKASDYNSDDDVEICKNTEVKENKLKQAEKKTKVDSNYVSGKATVDLTSGDEDGDQGGKEAVEVEEEKCSEKVRKVGTKAAKVERQSKTVTPQSSCTKTNVTSMKGNLRSTPKIKLTAKTDAKTDNSKTETISYVDISDSPVKDNSKSPKSTIEKSEPDMNDVSLIDETTEKVQNGNKNQVIEKELQSPEKECCEVSDIKNDKEKLVDGEVNESKESFSVGTETDSKPTKSEESEKHSGSKLQENAESKDKNILRSCDFSEVQEDVCPRKNILSKDDKKPKTAKKPKKKLVSPSSNSDRNTLTKLLASAVEKSSDKTQLEETKIKNAEELEEKDSGTNKVSEVNSPERNCPSSTDDSLFKTPSMNNISLNVSGESDSNTTTSTTSTPDTPTSSKKLVPKTHRKMTPKQLLKFKEKEELKMEKERIKQEKERKKEEEKQEKIKLKLEKEEEKKREKEEKEKKKQAEIDQRNEEKRLKEEEKQMKDEEKKSKAEERRKKEEEEKRKKEGKKLKEEQKEAEKRKSAQAFASFFVKSETKGSPIDEDKENTPVESNFKSFEVKVDMRLAPLSRVQLSEDRRHHLDQAIEDVETTDSLYLRELRSGVYTRGASEKTWPPSDDTDDDVMIIESEKPNDEMDTDCVEVEKKCEKRRHRAKLLQFHENRRPPYWGTWRKKSKFVRPRAPLNQDKTMFEYDVDSDDEWEEPEDGESLRGSEDEESQDEQYEEDNDMFVPHGYLSEEEGQDEMDDTSPEAMKAKLKFLQMEFEEEMSKKQERLKPRVIGCVWFCNSEADPKTVGSYIAEMFLTRRAVWEGSLPLPVIPSLSSSPSLSGESAEQSTDETRGARRKFVPESMIPEIIKKVHTSRRKLTRLLNEILEEQQDTSLRPSKRCLADKIREIATWECNTEIGHHCWFVKEELRQAHNLMDLEGSPVETASPLPASPSFNITKFTKVLTSDERLKLLREAPSSTKESPCINPAPKLSAVSSKQASPSVKMPSIKQLFAGKPSAVAKKRIQLVSVPPSESVPKQTSPSIMNFVQSSAKVTTPVAKATPSPNVNKSMETEKKTKKRIMPITLTTVVAKTPLAKPLPTPSQEECVVLSD